MKTRTLLMSTIVGAGFILCHTGASAAETITSGTVSTANSSINREMVSDPKVAATTFVEHVNYARVALAMKNSALAKQHIAQARNMATIIQGATADKRKVNEVETGRISYKYDTENKYHYFPIKTGPVQVKEISNGTSWAENNLAVTDADIVYLTVDLTDNKAETYLSNAEQAIADDDFKKADNELAELTDQTVSVDRKTSMPGDKARDNIALARNFINGRNYDGARYALMHADEALDELQSDSKYKKHHSAIIAMRADVKDMQTYITKKDPTVFDKAGLKMDKWWSEIKDWSAE